MQETTDKLKIEEYEIGAFLGAIQAAFDRGYRLDLETNEHYPQKFGSMLEVTLVMPLKATPVVESTEPVQQVTEEVTEETQPQVQRKGRKVQS